MKISAHGIQLEIEDHGSPQGEPLLLIMGLGMQLVAWHEDFVESLVQRGFRVIRFDNRDIGLSENFDRFGAPKLGLDMLRFALEDDRYAARLRAQTARVRARRRELFDLAYAGVPPAQLGPLRLAHRVAHQLAAIPSRLDPAVSGRHPRRITLRRPTGHRPVPAASPGEDPPIFREQN
jgi:hypothetical protein